MKILSETRDLIQALVAQMKQQSTQETDKKIHITQISKIGREM